MIVCWAGVCLTNSIYSCCMVCDQAKSCSDFCDVKSCKYFRERGEDVDGVRQMQAISTAVQRHGDA